MKITQPRRLEMLREPQVREVDIKRLGIHFDSAYYTKRSRYIAECGNRARFTVTNVTNAMV